MFYIKVILIMMLIGLFYAAIVGGVVGGVVGGGGLLVAIIVVTIIVGWCIHKRRSDVCMLFVHKCTQSFRNIDMTIPSESS